MMVENSESRDCKRMQSRLSLVENIGLLLLHHSPTVHELVHATCGVDKLSLTGVEWVRSGRNFNLDDWILLTFEHFCFVALGCGT